MGEELQLMFNLVCDCEMTTHHPLQIMNYKKTFILYSYHIIA